MVHASKELIEAMDGERPRLDRPGRWATDERSPEELGKQCGEGRIWMHDGGNEGHEASLVVDCPACRALFPEAIRVRLDWLEEHGRLP